MSRIIKFRAWDGKKMYFTDHGDIGRFNDCFEWSPYCFVIPEEDYPVPNQPEVEKWNIMQFTGLKDKRGVEIFEGDVMRGTHCEYIDGVRHDDYPDEEAKGFVEFGNYYINTGNEGHGMGNGSKLSTGWFVTDKYKRIYHPGELEVIGNVFENGDLLK